MDTYTKTLLTIIAISLTVIAIKLVTPQEANAGVFSSSPTVGDYVALREIKDPAARKKAYFDLLRSVPLIWVQGGQLNADVSSGF